VGAGGWGAVALGGHRAPRPLYRRDLRRTCQAMKDSSAVDRPETGGSKKPEASLQLEAIFRAFPDQLFSLDADGRILDYRGGQLSALPLPPEQYVGRLIEEIFPAEIGLKFGRAIHEAFKTGKAVSVEYRLQVPGGETWFEARLVPLDESRLVAVVREVTERAKAVEQFQSQVRRLAALHAIDETITASFDLSVTLSVILRQMINQLGMDAADILVFNPDTRTLEYAAGQGFQAKRLQLSPVMIGQGYAGRAALERRTISISDLASHPGDSLFPANIVQEKFATYYAVPLITKGQVRGVMEIYHRSVLHTDDAWLDFLATVASQTAVAIDCSRLFQDLQRSNTELSLAYDTTIESWAQVLELSNRESGAHIYRVVDLTIKLARFIGVGEEELVNFRRGALLHDIGKLGIAESILNKPGPLDEAEWDKVRAHPLLAYQLLSSVDSLLPALDIPHYHHERWDGSGYPEGLHGEQIPFSARLFAVVDVYDSLTSGRPYRPAWSHQAALEYIQQQSEKLFDPAIVKAFLQAMKTR
jgi:HD-GYP domain-containing protein (c-di-GMP phosphodiesterase class II)